MNETALKVTGDVAAAGAGLAALAGWLPPIAALFTVVWTGLQIYTWIENRGFLRGGKK